MAKSSQPNEHEKSLGEQPTINNDSPPFPNPANDLTGQANEIPRINLGERFKFQKVLGKGGMGEVLRAIDTHLNRSVAVKRIRGTMANDNETLERFIREAQTIAALNHPNIVRVYDYDRDAEGPFIIMELVEGESLQARIEASPLKLEDAVELTCQLCNALAVTHKKGIIHRDIKPANILLTNRGKAKLTDFGLVRQTWRAQSTTEGVLLGTLLFMSPEQRRNITAVDARSDLWSLTATLYQMVTGKSPKIIMFDDVPPELQPILSKGLEEDPADRYQNATELCNALRACLTKQPWNPRELKEVQCPSCDTSNDANRKYCHACGDSLIVSCLSCTIAIPLSKEVCDDCGANQHALVRQYRMKLEKQKEEAEKLQQQGDIDTAREIAFTLCEEPDRRFAHLASWARQFLQTLNENSKELLQVLPALLEEALQHESLHDYPSAITLLQQVPETLRNEPFPGHPRGVNEVLTRLIAKRSESQRLEDLILQRVQDRELSGLLAEVESILQLHPGRPDMLKVQEQLLQWEQKGRDFRDKCYSIAQQSFTEHDYERCLTELAKIEIGFATPETEDLRIKAEAISDSLTQLKKMIDSAVQRKFFPGLRKLVEEYLELKPNTVKMQNLHQKLLDWENKHALRIDEILKKAEILRQACRFNDAANLLRKSPSELHVPQVLSLQDDCQSLANTRERALAALQEAKPGEDLQSILEETEPYRALLSFHSYQDPIFLRQFQVCEHAYRQEQELLKTALKKRTRARKRIFIGASLAITLLLVIAGITISSKAQQIRIANLLKNQEWNKVLSLDKDNVQALIGRAQNGLQSKAVDIKDVFADLERANRLDSDAAQLAELHGLAYLKRANLRAQRDQIDAAEKDLQAAETLRTHKTQQAPARQALVAAYLRRAAISLENKELDAVLNDCDLAEEQGSSLNALASLRLGAYQEKAKKLIAIGDMQEAQDILDTAFKLGIRRPSLLKTIELLHIKLGQQALASNNHLTASKELAAALKIGHQKIAQLSPRESDQIRELQSLTGHRGKIWDLVFSPDGKQIATASEDQTIRIWSATRGQLLRTLKGHTGTVWGLAFSPNGQQLVSGGSSDKQRGDVILWDLAKGKPLHKISGHALTVQDVAFSPNGKQLASASWDSTIKIWEIATGKLQRTLQGHSGVVQAVAFNPDGTSIASASGDRTAKIWDVSTGKTLLTLNGHGSRVSSVSFHPDGTQVISASSDKTIRIWSARTGQELQVLTGHTDAISQVAFNVEGKQLASASADQTIRVWETATGKLLLTLTGHTREVHRLDFDSQGKRLASTSNDGTVKVWDIADVQQTSDHHAQLQQLAIGIAEVTMRAFERDANNPNRDATVAALNQVAKFKLDSNEAMDLRSRFLGILSRPIVAYENNASAANREASLKALKGVAALDSGAEIYATLHSRIITVIARPVADFEKDTSDTNKDAALAAIKLLEKTNQNRVQSMNLRKRVANSLLQRAAKGTSGNNMNEVIINVEQALELVNRSLLEASAKATVVNALADACLMELSQKQIKPAATYYVIVSRLDNKAKNKLSSQFATLPASTLEELSLSTLEHLPLSALGKLSPRTLKLHKGPVYSVSFSPDGKQLASAGKTFDHQGEVKLWDMASGEMLLSKHCDDPVRSIAYSLDGKQLAAATGVGQNERGRAVNGEVKIWNATMKEVLSTLPRMTTPVLSVAFSPDGTQLATASDSTVKIWKISTGELLQTLNGHTDRVRIIVFSPNGKWIASAGMDKEIKVWKLTTGENVRIFNGHRDKVFSLAFSPNGNWLASAGQDNYIKIWDVSTGQELLTLKGHDKSIRAVAFSSNGKRLASASADHTVKVWNPLTGQLLTTLKGHKDTVSCIAFSPNGKRLASGSMDKTIRLWFISEF